MLNSRKPSLLYQTPMTLPSGTTRCHPSPTRPFTPLKLRQAIVDWLHRLRQVWLMLLVSLLLSGCVRYDVGIRFDSPHRGEIVQHIQVEQRLKSFSSATVQQWVQLIQSRSQQLGGRIERLPDDDLLVTIPFTSSADLQTKFNQFYRPVEDENPAIATAVDLPTITSHLAVSTSNLLLLERNQLRYDLDLRSLGVLSANGNVLLSPAALIDLEFRLTTPWGARSIAAASTTQPELTRSDKTLVWQLVPGAQNHLEVVFWLPSPIGIGAVVIVLFVVIGRYVKYPRSIAAPDHRTAL